MAGREDLLNRKPFKLSYDWCSHNFNTWYTWFGQLSGKDEPVAILEIGCWEGASAVFWMSEVLNQSGHLCLVDHFDANEGPGRERRLKLDYNLSLAQEHGGAGRTVEVIADFSQPALMELQKRAASFDVIYVDGDHTAKGVLADALLAWPMVKSNGFMLFDDYLWPTQGMPGSWPHSPPSFDSPEHPKPGIDAFLGIMREELEVIHEGYQVLVRKTVPGPNFPHHVNPDLVQVVMAFDEACAMGAAAAIRSLFAHCSAPHNLQLGIVDMGLCQPTKAALQQLLPESTTVDWLSAEQALGGLRKAASARQPGLVGTPQGAASNSPSLHVAADGSGGSSSGGGGGGGTGSAGDKAAVAGAASDFERAFVKLGLGAAVPRHTRRALYLDADVLVLGDVCQLWRDTAGNRAPLLAVPDFGFPAGHAGLPHDRFNRLRCTYFNAGVLLFDVEAFQAAAPDMHSLAVSHRWRFEDQDVLNMAFAEQWAPLDLRWNAQGLGSYARFRVSGTTDQPALLTLDGLKDLEANTKIVHFSGSRKLSLQAMGNQYIPCTLKPWHGVSTNPYTSKWFEALEGTPWKGWMPDKAESIARLQEQVRELVDMHWSLPKHAVLP